MGNLIVDRGNLSASYEALVDVGDGETQIKKVSYEWKRADDMPDDLVIADLAERALDRVAGGRLVDSFKHTVVRHSLPFGFKVSLMFLKDHNYDSAVFAIGGYGLSCPYDNSRFWLRRFSLRGVKVLLRDKDETGFTIGVGAANAFVVTFNRK